MSLKAWLFSNAINKSKLKAKYVVSTIQYYLCQQKIYYDYQ
jgi:hypothetical protein